MSVKGAEIGDHYLRVAVRLRFSYDVFLANKFVL